jgi:hypothetical protein
MTTVTKSRISSPIIPKDPTKYFQKRVRNTINECPETIHKDKKGKYTNLNPAAPTIRGLPKIHKENFPILPIINWKNAPPTNWQSYSLV